MRWGKYNYEYICIDQVSKCDFVKQSVDNDYVLQFELSESVELFNFSSQTEAWEPWRDNNNMLCGEPEELTC